MLHVEKAVTIRRPRAEVYAYWRDLEHLAQFMHHVKSVVVLSNTRSHWTVAAPGGNVEWDADIVGERAGEFISWRSLEGSEVMNEGTVRFSDAPADRGTEVRVALSYDAPAGSVGAAIAKLFGEAPIQQLTDDLRRFKQVMETGEVVLSEGSLEGAGEGASHERPAQAPAEEVRK